MTATMGKPGRGPQHHQTRKASVQRFRIVRRLDDLIESRQSLIAAIFAAIGLVSAFIALFRITPSQLHRILPF